MSIATAERRFDSRIRRRDKVAKRKWLRCGSIYGLCLPTFCDGNGDGIGDFLGAMEKLDYIKSLGVDAIWLTPFFKSPLRDFGYDISDQLTVDPRFGSEKDFKTFLGAAHQHGLKVIVEIAIPHTSDQHPWFVDSVERKNGKDDWYVWADPILDKDRNPHPPNNWRAMFGGKLAWTWHPKRRQYYLHHFHDHQPQLNFYNPDVRKALIDIAEHFIHLGVDGGRIDALDCIGYDPNLTDNLPVEVKAGDPEPSFFNSQHHDRDMMQREITEIFLKELRARMNELEQKLGRSHLALIGEFSSQPGAFARIARYSDNGETMLDGGYTLELSRRELTIERLNNIITQILDASPDPEHPNWPAFQLSTHDDSRFGERHKEVPFQKMALFLFRSLGGVVGTMMGHELGLTDGKIPQDRIRDTSGYENRDSARTPPPLDSRKPNNGFSSADEKYCHLPPDPDHGRFAVDIQEMDPYSVLNSYREANVFGNADWELFANGGFRRLDGLGKRIFGHVRWNEEESKIFLFNFSDQWVLVPFADLPDLPQVNMARPPYGFEQAAVDMEAKGIYIPPYGFYQGDGPGLHYGPTPLMPGFGTPREEFQDAVIHRL